ncbi:SO2930 family diheme c-type cytochrome [Hyphomonas johnsonii]|uniref:Putative lipoprotein n=1 Tax=Hyphomonas johnsonii MHS-2 TaxID=1280950 RepID=A0A059FHR4_9PROT|nr:SO2930 family diheme c-type cytochrome [Hyphomonas johnsonii]KCZ90056.1 putative lipoprotein [Hyphomonas johnsonii MHS-2]
MKQFACLAAALVLLAACGARGGEAARSPGPDLSVVLAETPAPTLADYGFFKDAAAEKPADGVVAYDLINPLFSDHALKHRFVFVPQGRTAAYSDTAAMDFPVGTALIKTFAFAPDLRTPEVGQYKVETRVLIRKEDGWAAFPYAWNAAGTVATYAPTGGTRKVSVTTAAGASLVIDYAIPNKNQCKTCHQDGEAVLPIGPKARNLNHDGPAGVNQLVDWRARGMLDGLPGHPPVAPAIHDVRLPVADRARAYLDINCGHCHKATGSASNSGLWLDSGETSPVHIGVGKHPTAAGRGAGDSLYVIAPGAPDQSIMVYRMASTEPGVAMPELGRTVVDEDGVALVREWIASMDAAELP